MLRIPVASVRLRTGPDLALVRQEAKRYGIAAVASRLALDALTLKPELLSGTDCAIIVGMDFSGDAGHLEFAKRVFEDFTDHVGPSSKFGF